MKTLANASCLAILYISSIAYADIYAFNYNQTEKIVHSACERQSESTFDEWRANVLKSAFGGWACKQVDQAENKVVCDSERFGEMFRVAEQSQSACNSDRDAILKQFRGAYSKRAKDNGVVFVKNQNFSDGDEGPSTSKAVDRAEAVKLWEEKKCNNLISFDVRRKIDSNTYLIANISREMVMYRGLALLETKRRKFSSTGEAGNLRVEVHGEKSVPMQNGFEKKMPYMIESSDCNSYFKVIHDKKSAVGEK